MQREIPFYILRLLDSNGRVTVDGLGVFSMTSIPAYIDNKAAKIYPPRRTGKFQSGNQSDDILPAFISDKTGAAIDACRDQVAAFAGMVNEETRENAPFDIEAFGKFWRDPKGDLAFTPNAKAFNQRFVYFKTLDIEPASLATPIVPPGETETPPEMAPVQSEVMTRTEDKVQIKGSIPEKETINKQNGTKRSSHVRRRNLAFLLLLVLLILIAVSWLFILDKPEQTENDTARIRSLIELQEQSAETVNETHPPATDERSSTEAAEEGDLVTEPEVKTEEKAAIAEQETTALTFSGDVNADDWQCLIVTGSLAKAANVDRMIKRLSTLGFSVRIWSEDGLTKVGIPIECGEQNWRPVLEKVRAEVEPAAWLFKK